MKTNFLKVALESEMIQQAAVNDEEMNRELDIIEQGSQIQFEELEDVDKVIDAADSINSLTDAAGEEPVESTVKVLTVATESILEKIGMSSVYVISVESDDPKSTFERIKEIAIKLWEKIVALFEHVYEAIKDFMAVAFSASVRIEKAAIERLKVSRKLEGSPKRTTYENEQLAKSLNTGEKIGLVTSYDRVIDLVEATIDANYARPGKKALDILNSTLEYIEKSGSESAISSMRNDLVRVIKEAYVERSFKKISNSDSVEVTGLSTVGIETYTTPILTGGYGGILVVPTTPETISKLTFRILPVDEIEEVSTNSIMVSDTHEQNQLITQVIRCCSFIRKFESNVMPTIDQIDKQLKSGLKKLKQSVKNNNDSDKEIKEAIKLLGFALPKIAQGTHHRTFAFALNTSRNILKHIDYSIAAWK